ncbi:MAG: hypothetical protein RL235_258 [Chlamydiota bacterium]|jgi:hypothetical protein
MRPREAIASVLHLFILFLFVMVSASCFALARLPEARLRLAHLVLDEPETLTEIGVALLIVTVLIGVAFWGLERGRLLILKKGKPSVAVDVELVRQTLAEILKKESPLSVAVLKVSVGRQGRLEIGLHTGKADPLKEPELIAQVERSFETILKSRFGYVKSFSLFLKSNS